MGRNTSFDFSSHQKLLQNYDEEEFPGSRFFQSHRTKNITLHWTAHFINFCLILSLIAIQVRSLGNFRSSCWEAYNYNSPVNKAIDNTPYEVTRFNGSLWFKSPFKGPPTKEVEEAWHSIMQYGMIAVSARDIELVKQNASTAAKFPPEVGGGYIAATVGTHQIHCLHYVWQDHHMASLPVVQTRRDADPGLYERHYEHCVDYIRQSLMCNFDTGILTYNWVRDHNNPTPNANTMHKCVNWGHLQSWLAEKAVRMPEGFEWKQPVGALSLDDNP